MLRRSIIFGRMMRQSLGSSLPGAQCAAECASTNLGPCGLWRTQHLVMRELGETIDHVAIPCRSRNAVNAVLLYPAAITIPIMEAFLLSTAVVALAEMGDKTQLLSLVLAAKYRKPWPIVLGIFVSTLVNHALAGAVGAWVTTVLGPDVLRWILGVSFILMAGWMLIPDKIDEDEAGKSSGRWGVFGTTLVLFFLAEMGDKTQLATVGLAAKYPASYYWVVAGTTIGMMLANAPVVWFGDKITKKLPIRWIHRVCAVIFLVLGVVALVARIDGS